MEYAIVPEYPGQVGREGNVGVLSWIHNDSYSPVYLVWGEHCEGMTVSRWRRFSVDVVNYDCVASVRGQMVGEESVVNVGVQGFVQVHGTIEQKVLPFCGCLILKGVAKPVTRQTSHSHGDQGRHQENSLD